MVTTRPPKTIVKPTALGPVANTDTKLLIYGLFQKGRVLAQDGVGEIPTDLHHERAVRPGSDSSNVYFSRRQLDDDEHMVGHKPADRGDLNGEEVSRSNGSPMGGEKRAPRRPLTSIRRGLDAMFPQNIGDGAPGYGIAEIREAPRMRVYPHLGFDFAIPPRTRRTSVRRSFLPQSRALRTLFSSSK